MSLLRKQVRTGYTHIANDLVAAEELSYRARGIAIFLLSKPDDWQIKIEYLVKHGREGREAIRAALKELAEHGYLMRDRIQDERGQMCTVTRVADYPAFLHTGTATSRILGYETDPPENRRSDTRTPVNRQVGNPKLLLNTEQRTTRSSHNRGRKKYTDEPAPTKRRSYHPDDYDD